MHFGFLVIPPVRQQQNMINTNPSYCAECNDVCLFYLQRWKFKKSWGVFRARKTMDTNKKCNCNHIHFVEFRLLQIINRGIRSYLSGTVYRGKKTACFTDFPITSCIHIDKQQMNISLKHI